MLVRVARALSCPPQFDLGLQVALSHSNTVEDDVKLLQDPLSGGIDGDGVGTADAHPGVGRAAHRSAARSSFVSSSATTKPITRDGIKTVEGEVQGSQPSTGAGSPSSKSGGEASAPRSGAVKSWGKRVGRAHGHHGRRRR